jgi:hypothetical protein
MTGISCVRFHDIVFMVYGVVYGDLGENGLRASTLVRGGEKVIERRLCGFISHVHDHRHF